MMTPAFRSLPAILLLLGCALPANAVEVELKRRGFVGLRTAAPGSGPGAMVTEVRPGGFGATHDVRKDDVVISVGGKSITTPAEFRATIRTLRAGEKIALEIRRPGTTAPVRVESTLVEEPRETYPSTEVTYGTVRGQDGARLRTIVTKPRSATGKLPVIFVAGWLSENSVEAPDATKDPTGLVLRGLAEMPGFATFRIDKPGSGDSEGNCAETDFDAELAGYRAAFASLSQYDFIDPNRVFILGISNGGGFAPLVPPTTEDLARVRGFVVVGGWVKTWFEHMLEIERRRLSLAGRSPEEVNNAMREVTELYHGFLIRGEKPADLFKGKPALQKIWPEDKDAAHLYGRPVSFYQQLQKLNLAAAWSKVKVPTLTLHGQYDWIMSREDHELIAGIVNANAPGAAQFVPLPDTGHTFQYFTSMAAAFKGEQQPFDPALLQRLTAWFEEHD